VRPPNNALSTTHSCPRRPALSLFVQAFWDNGNWLLHRSVPVPCILAGNSQVHAATLAIAATIRDGNHYALRTRNRNKYLLDARRA
jgi:hypothetical protein